MAIHNNGNNAVISKKLSKTLCYDGKIMLTLANSGCFVEGDPASDSSILLGVQAIIVFLTSLKSRMKFFSHKGFSTGAASYFFMMLFYAINVSCRTSFQVITGL